MKRFLLPLTLLLIATVATGGNDIWQSLFKEKLQEAKQGDSTAQFDVASMYQNGRGVTPDLSKAIAWYQKSAAQNNEKAVSRLKILEANEERFKKVLALADQGDAESQYKLGKMYTEGAGTNINYNKATAAFENAAKQGHAKAEYKLGLNYYEGTGVRRNRKTAYQWFKAAAKQNHPASQYYLGKIYAAGSGVKQNYTTSLEWLNRAIEGGFNQARGEMIDVSEKMKRAGKSKPAGSGEVAAIKKEAVALTSKAGSEDSQTRIMEVDETGNTPEFSIEDLMVAEWNRDSKPVAYLPSAISNCRTEESNIACYSDNQTRKSGNSIIKFKTKSAIKEFSRDGAFKVTYRNLVVNPGVTDHVDSSKDDEEPGGENDHTAGAYAVKTGWGKEHILECQLKDSGTVSCLKNKTHALILISPHTLVSGR